MIHPSTDLSEEAIEREAEQMLCEIRAFHTRTHATNEDTKRISTETKAILQRLKSDLKLS